MAAEAVTPNAAATSTIYFPNGNSTIFTGLSPAAVSVSFLFHATDINRQDARRAKIKNLFYMLVTPDSAANLCGS
jgi:hypothetical protein